jgi:hypothetical protein
MISVLLAMVLSVVTAPHAERLQPGVYVYRTMDFTTGEFTVQDVLLVKTQETVIVTMKNTKLVGIVGGERIQFMAIGHIDCWMGSVEENKVRGHVLNPLGKVKNFILEKK